MSVFSILFSLIYLSRINLQLALIIFSCSPFLLLITLAVRRKHIMSSRAARRSLARINSDVNSSVSGIRITKAFNNADKRLHQFDAVRQARQSAAGNVSLNYELTEKTDSPVREGDVLSLPGRGKGKITGMGGSSRKGRQYVYAERYK